MLLVLGNRKPSVLNVGFYLHSIEMAERYLAEPFAHEQFGASHMIRRHCCIGGALREAHPIAGHIDDILAIAIATADSANVTDVRHRSETMKCSHSRGVTPPTQMCRPRRIS